MPCTKYKLEKFYGKVIFFSLDKAMEVFLFQKGVYKALREKTKKSEKMSDEIWKGRGEASGAIYLNLGDEAIHDSPHPRSTDCSANLEEIRIYLHIGLILGRVYCDLKPDSI